MGKKIVVIVSGQVKPLSGKWPILSSCNSLQAKKEINLVL